MILEKIKNKEPGEQAVNRVAAGNASGSSSSSTERSEMNGDESD